MARADEFGFNPLEIEWTKEMLSFQDYISGGDYWSCRSCGKKMSIIRDGNEIAIPIDCHKPDCTTDRRDAHSYIYHFDRDKFKQTKEKSPYRHVDIETILKFFPELS
jgi:hypothetical protein